MQKQGSVQRGIDGLARKRVPGAKKKREKKVNDHPPAWVVDKVCNGEARATQGYARREGQEGRKGDKEGTQREIRDRRAAFPPARLGVCLFSFGGYV